VFSWIFLTGTVTKAALIARHKARATKNFIVFFVNSFFCIFLFFILFRQLSKAFGGSLNSAFSFCFLNKRISYFTAFVVLLLLPSLPFRIIKLAKFNLRTTFTFQIDTPTRRKDIINDAISMGDYFWYTRHTQLVGEGIFLFFGKN